MDSSRLDIDKKELDFIPILSILEKSGLCYTIKNKNLEYLYISDSFKSLFGIKENVKTDFDVFLDDTAYKMSQIDLKVVTSEKLEESECVLITKTNNNIIANISRSIVNQDGDDFLVSIITDITKKTQEKQFEAYKKILSEKDVFEKMLNRFSNLIFSSNSQKEIFEGVGNLCLELLNLEDLSFLLLDSKKKVLKQVLVVQRDKPILYDIDSKWLKKIDISAGITGRCATSKETIIVDDVTLDSDFVPDSLNCKSEIAVPIIYKNEVLGVIDSESPIYANFNDKIKRTIEGIATLLAIKLKELESFNNISKKNKELRLLISNNPAAMAMLDVNCNYLEVSKNWIDHFVISKDESVIGKDFFEGNNNFPKSWRRRINLALEGKANAILNESFRTHEGDQKNFIAKVNPWYKDNNDIGGVILMADNITNQEKSQLELSQTSAELNEARKLGKLFSWEYDFNTERFTWNGNNVEVEAFESDKRYELESIYKLLDKEYQIPFSKELERVFKVKDYFDFIHPMNILDKKYWLHSRGKVYKNRDGSEKIIGSSQNITIRINAENAYKAKNLQLHKVNKELDQFIYKTAHDLRAPLGNLIGLIDIMRVEQNKNILNSYFDLQEQSIEKLLVFIDKIGTHTKNVRLPLEQVKLNYLRIVDEVLRSHYYIANSDKITKIVHIDRDINFLCDKERITIILNNLISNAIRFCDLTKEKPLIEITIKLQNESLYIAVKDNGIGIVDNRMEKVFDMFYRGHKSSTGSGIGLYILQETVDYLKGTVTLNSKEDEYTEVSILLPKLNIAADIE